MNKCNKRVFVKFLQKYKRCLRNKNHTARCLPNLIGEKVGFLTIKKLEKPIKIKKRLRQRWVVEQGGFLRTVFHDNLMYGNMHGLKFISGFSSENGKLRPEYRSVYHHYKYTFDSKTSGHKYYKGMPFYDEWNPKKGGVIWLGVKWIIENLGKRPNPKWSLDIIKHELGFVPGNLRWARKHTQTMNQRHKRLGLYSLQEIRVEAKRHGY